MRRKFEEPQGSTEVLLLDIQQQLQNELDTYELPQDFARQVYEVNEQYAQGEITSQEYNLRLLQIASNYRHVYFELIERCGFKHLAALKTDIPLRIWKQLELADPEFAAQLEIAMDAADEKIQYLVFTRALQASRPSAVTKGMADLLRLRRPEKYNVSIRKSVSREQIIEEVLQNINLALLQALNEAGVDTDVQIKVINSFTQRFHKSNKQSD